MRKIILTIAMELDASSNTDEEWQELKNEETKEYIGLSACEELAGKGIKVSLVSIEFVED